MAAPLAVGRYCRFCGFFEEADDLAASHGPCEACGCEEEHHIAAEVVATGFDLHHLEPPKENTR